MNTDTKDLSLHPGGTELTKNIFRTAMDSTAAFRDKRVTLMTEKRRIPEEKPLKILDAGCGIGTSLAALKEEFGIEAFGIDSSSGSIEKAKELHPDISFAYCDASYLPYNEEYFDGILSECMLTLLPDPKSAVCEWKRVLKTGGFMIISGLCERDPGDLQYAFRPSLPYDAQTSVICKNGLIDKEALRSYVQYLGLVSVYEKDCREELISYMSETIMEYGSLEERIKKEQEATGSSVLDCSVKYDPKKISYVAMIFKKS
ncbi:MAG: methyltransferase domain-containing protein [Firmicutes bacterium]|nr:methyltransferase domain-containing protein [Bacillota bacterium]